MRGKRLLRRKLRCAALRKATPIAYGFGSDSADSVRQRPTTVGAS
jgi:hypothetical protein